MVIAVGIHLLIGAVRLAKHVVRNALRRGSKRAC